MKIGNKEKRKTEKEREIVPDDYEGSKVESQGTSLNTNTGRRS